MIYHNAKNGFPSAIYDEEYRINAKRIYTTPSGEVTNDSVHCTVVISHDFFLSLMSIRTEDEIYVIPMDKIIADILEVEHENETLFSDH